MGNYLRAMSGYRKSDGDPEEKYGGERNRFHDRNIKYLAYVIRGSAHIRWIFAVCGSGKISPALKHFSDISAPDGNLGREYISRTMPGATDLTNVRS